MSWKAQSRRLINRVLEPAGFTLRRFQPEMRVREMISPQVRARQITAFRAAMAQSLEAFPELAQRLPPEADIRSFTEALPHCPVMQDTGGGGFSAAVLLWTLARAIDPSLIVESGTFRGFTTWVLRQAAPKAWMDLPLDCPAQTPALIYFDDHVDQWRRIREAAARGFRYLVFDDSLPSTALHNDGWAAAPTVDMLFETDIADGEEIRWRTECGPFSYRYDVAQAAETRALIRHHVRLPDLRFIFGYAPANLVMLELHQIGHSNA